MRMLVAIAMACSNAFGAEGRFEEAVVHSTALEGNLLGDSPDRNVTICLPPTAS